MCPWIGVIEMDEEEIREEVERIREDKVRSFSIGSNCLWSKEENAHLNAFLDVLGEEYEYHYELNRKPVLKYLSEKGIQPSPLVRGIGPSPKRDEKGEVITL